MWYEKTYVNRRNWLLENMKELDCSLEEGYMLLLLDYCNEFNLAIDLDKLSQYTNKEVKAVDVLLNQLMIKGYVSVKTLQGKIVFDLSAVFDQHQRKPMDVPTDLFELFEEEFKRPLSEKEMTQLSIWSKKHNPKLIVYALKEALIQDKVAFAYINRILENWKADNKTLKDFENE
jgi:DNA replication protein